MSIKQANFAAERISNPFLQSPAPSHTDIEYLMQAAIRAPDHGNLTPFRFIVVSQHQLDQLGQMFLVSSQAQGDIPEIQADKLLKMPHRAPMVIISIATLVEHPKVPKNEQLITAGLAVHQLCSAAKEIGFDSMWRTGNLATNKKLCSLLNLAQNEEITGFIYIGTAYKTKPNPTKQTVSHIFKHFGE
ncbi:nitroreductase family protein [Marinicellulosiphila megalodicopiae]|uniref:nitroreductase family protein n=1 Tax=Marinicellulosiphila megalodicopiae TaxID=2724896 RepID=UPI003BAEE7BD